jgi:phage shock protein C
MHNANLFTRDDTFFGVCEAIGEDTGIPANLLRVALAFLLFFYPVAVIAGYLGTGVVVAVSRWLFPAPRRAAAAPGEAQAPPARAREEATKAQVELPLAA